MFKRMTKIKKLMNEKDSYTILENGSYGVLGTLSDNGYPYTVPLNYVYYQNKIYFHCAKTGHKLDNIKKHEKVSFTVVGNESIIEKEFTTKYKSVTLFGVAKIIEPSREILMELVKKYSKNFVNLGREVVDKDFLTAAIVEITINHITGKESK